MATGEKVASRSKEGWGWDGLSSVASVIAQQTSSAWLAGWLGARVIHERTHHPGIKDKNEKKEAQKNSFSNQFSPSTLVSTGHGQLTGGRMARMKILQ